MRVERAAHRRVVAGAAAVVAAVTLAACGDGGDGDDGARDREQVRATVERLYDAIDARDGAAVCAELNEAAQDQVAAGGKPGQSCAESFQDFLDEADETEGGLALTSQARIVSVKVKGDRATVKVRFGARRNSPAGDIPLTRVDGRWKLEAVGGQAG